MYQHQKLAIQVALLLCAISTNCHAFSAPYPTLKSPPLIKSYVKIFDPCTNANIIILGCIHGTLSSSEDVRYLMESEPIDAVVLELCDTRIKDLARETVDEYTIDVFMEDIRDFWSFIKGTNEKKGPLVATITFVLGMMGMLQTNLSGIQSGLEFAVAMDIAEEKDCGIVLADRTIDETMKRISKLPDVSLEMVKNNSIGVESKLLKNAIFGDNFLQSGTQLNIPHVLFRSKKSVNDLVRLTLPPILLTTIFSLLIGLALNLPLYVEQEYIELLVENMTILTNADRVLIILKLISSFLGKLIVFGIGYTLFALPASKVIVTERDVYLAKGIKEACQELSDDSSESKSSRRIVAVLGLLHVNGVAKQLLDSGAIPIREDSQST